MPAYTNICRHCGVYFTAYRLSSRYCGATCRQQAHRARIHEERVAESLKEVLAAVQEGRLPKPSSSSIDIDAAAILGRGSG